MTVKLHESVATILPEALPEAGRFRVQIISPGLGSSGYYPAETIESAIDRKVWAKGTHIYLDHPGVTESSDRPERSLRDLVGVLATDATRAAGGAAEAEVRIYSPYRALLTEMADDIGLSIRATGEVTMGEADGYHGPIVTALHEAQSVDFVTKAGRGGRVLEVLEAARPLAETTADDLADQLRRAIKAEYENRDADRYVWMRDFDPDRSLAYFEADNKTWQQGYARSDDNLSITLAGQRMEVRPVTTYLPVTSAGQLGESAPVTTTKEAVMTTVQIDEARLNELTAAADRVTAMEAERDSALQRAEAAEADARKVAREAYNTQVGTALAASDLPDAARQRLAESLTISDDTTTTPPLSTISDAIEAEAAYLAAITPKRPLGFGGSPAPVAESYTTPWGRTINAQEA